MKKSKSIVLAALIITMLTSSLAGCGRVKDTTASGSEEVAAGQMGEQQESEKKDVVIVWSNGAATKVIREKQVEGKRNIRRSGKKSEHVPKRSLKPVTVKLMVLVFHLVQYGHWEVILHTRMP